jgi:hypothetical protein
MVQREKECKIVVAQKDDARRAKASPRMMSHQNKVTDSSRRYFLGSVIR